MRLGEIRGVTDDGLLGGRLLARLDRIDDDRVLTDSSHNNAQKTPR